MTWHTIGRPCGAQARESEGITEFISHITCPVCYPIAHLKQKAFESFMSKEDYGDIEQAARAFEAGFNTGFKTKLRTNEQQPRQP